MKSKRTKLTDIPEEVKQIVYKRDHGRCIACGELGLPNAHFIRRSQGGLGVPENVVTLCPKCHHDYDNGFYRDEMENYIRQYLKSIYGASWNETKLVYNKWNGFKFNK